MPSNSQHDSPLARSVVAPVGPSEDNIDSLGLQEAIRSLHIDLQPLRRAVGLVRFAQRAQNPKTHQSGSAVDKCLINVARAISAETRVKTQKDLEDAEAKVRVYQEKISSYQRLFRSLGTVLERSIAIEEQCARMSLPRALVHIVTGYEDKANAYDEAFYTNSGISYTFPSPVGAQPPKENASVATLAHHRRPSWLAKQM